MFSRKKKVPVQKSATRQRAPTDFSLPGIPGFDPTIQDNDADLEAELFALTGRKQSIENIDFDGGSDDDDLEAELSRILGKTATKSKSKNKPSQPSEGKPTIAVDPSILGEVEEGFASDDDIDENDPDLLNELQMLTHEEEIEIYTEDDEAKEEEEDSIPSQFEMIKSRLEAYRAAERNAKENNESARARRFNRGVKTLEKLMSRAQKGEFVPFDEIPPEIARPVPSAPKAVGSSSPSAVTEKTNNVPPEDDNNYVVPPSKLETPSGCDTEIVDRLETLTCEENAGENIIDGGENIEEQPSQYEVIKTRLEAYKAAELKAKVNNDAARSRRFNRGIKTLEMLLKKSQNGEVVPFDEIPPEIAQPRLEPTKDDWISNPTSPPPIQSDKNESLPGSLPTVTAAKHLPGENISASKMEEPPTEDHKSTQEPTPVVEMRTKPLPFPSPAPLVAGPSITPIMEKLITRRSEYRKMALVAKNEGNKLAALEHVRLMKVIEGLINRVEIGENVTHNDIPPSPSAVLPSSQPRNSSRAPSHSKQLPLMSTEIFSVPKTVEDALNQRLEYYSKLLRKAETSGRRVEAKKCGDIVRIYQNAIRLHRRGSNVPFEKLPTPPGCPPIPLVFKM